VGKRFWKLVDKQTFLQQLLQGEMAETAKSKRCCNKGACSATPSKTPHLFRNQLRIHPPLGQWCWKEHPLHYASSAATYAAASTAFETTRPSCAA